MTEQPDTAEKRRLSWDGTITAGNLLTALVLLVGVIGWGFELKGEMALERVMRERLETEIRSKIAADETREREAIAHLRADVREVRDLLLRLMRTGQRTGLE